jgi:hypothetical protein
MSKNREKNTKTIHSYLNTIINDFLPFEIEELICTEAQNAFEKIIYTCCMAVSLPSAIYLMSLSVLR